MPSSAPISNAFCQKLTQDFNLQQFEDFQKFFVPSHVRHFSKFTAEIAALVHKIAHLIFQGIWISSSEVGKKINEYRFTSNLQEHDELELSAEFSKILGSGKYEDFFEEAMKESWHDKIINGLSFLDNFIRHPLETGAILPSSKFLAERVSKHVVPSADGGVPRHYLEVGAGTGEFTYRIIQNLGKADHLDVVEYDQKFCDILRRRFGHLKNVSIHCASITDWKTDGYRYDTIVSGLPLNAFTAGMVALVYLKFKELIKEEGHLSYFEYPFISKLKKAFLPKQELQELEEVFKIKEEFRKKFQVSSEIEWVNMPPARAIHCKVAITA